MIIYKLLLSILIAITIFSTTYNVFGLFFYPRGLIAVLGFVISIFFIRRRFFFILLFLEFFLILLTAIPAISHWNFENFFVVEFSVIRGILVSLNASVFLVYCVDRYLNFAIEKKQFWELVVEIFLLALLSQFFVTLFHLLFEETRLSYLSFVNLSEHWREMSYALNWRFNGIGGISIYDTAIAYSLMSGLILVRNISKINCDFKFILLVLVALCLSALHGRSGLIFIVMLFAFVFVGDFFYFKPKKNIFFNLIFCLMLISLFSISIMGEDNLEKLTQYSLEIFYNLFSGNGFRTESTDDFFENHLIWPSLEVFIFGTSFWVEPGIGNVENSTDSGILLLINYGGIFFTLFFFTTIFAILYFYMKGIGELKKQGAFYLLYIYVFVILFMTSWKGPIFLSEPVMVIIFLIFGLTSRFRLYSNIPLKTRKI